MKPRSGGHRCLRGAAVASIALAPVLAFVMPAAHADTVVPTVPTETTAVAAVAYDVPTDTTVPTTDTTVPTTDTTVVDPPPTDPPTTTPVTDPPPTDPPTTTTLPPDTTPPDTTPPETTPPTSTPDSVPPVVVPPTDPPTSPGGGTGGGSSPTAPKKNTPPVRRLIESFPQELLGTTSSQTSGPIHAVAAAISVPVNVRDRIGAAVSAGETLTARLSDAFGSGSPDSSWGGLGSAAPRFGPWIVLVAVAWLARTVAASVLADRTAGPRRRRWTLL